MKLTKKSIDALNEIVELADANGCVTVDNWISGKGRNGKPRTLPPFCHSFTKKEYAPTQCPTHGTPERVAFDFFRANPTRRRVIVIDYKGMIAALHGVEV